MPNIPPFQRRITNPLQRPLSSDLNLQAFYDSITQAYMGGIMFSPSPSAPERFPTGFVGNSFRCSAVSGQRKVISQLGLGFINQTEVGGVNGVGVGSYVPVVCEPTSPSVLGVQLDVAPLGAGLSRIDIVCVKPPSAETDIQNVGILNPTASTFSFQPRPLQFTESVNTIPTSLQVITGTPVSGTPAAPAVPSGYLEIARIYVPSGSGALSNSNIEDRRFVLLPHGGRSMTLEFDAALDPPTVLGFNFGNNGISAVVRSVIEGPPPRKYFEVYVDAGIGPSVFRLNSAGVALPEQASLVTNSIDMLTTGVVSRTIVSRDSALPVFEAAGGFYNIIGPSVAKFIVVAGKQIIGTPDSIRYFYPDDFQGFSQPMMIRLNLYAQSF